MAPDPVPRSLVDPGDLSLVCNIAAGPLESVISDHGEHAMDLIERAVNTNPTLLLALAGVWCWSQPVRPRIDRILAQHSQDPL